jgi:hypothetical protein
VSFVATIAGTSYVLPTEGDEGWGPETSSWMAAVSTQLLQRSGGTFTLTADVNFGANFATVQAYLKSRTANISTAGFVRMARTDAVAWRNAANSDNLLLTVDGSNNLTFNGVIIPTAPAGVLPAANGGTGISSYTVGDILYATGATTLAKLAIGTANYVMVSNGTAPGYALLVNANLDAAAAIDFSKLAALTAGNILVGSAGNVATSVAMSGDILISNTGATSYNGTVPINKGGTGATTQTDAFDALSPATTRGDLITRNASDNIRLALGAAGTVLRSDGTDASWGAFAPMRRQVFTSSGTFNIPALITSVKVTVIGAGGGGGGCQTTGPGNAAEAGGGGGGGASIKWVTGLTPGGSETVTVGTGGGGGAAGANNGTAGNTSSFGSHCSATGGAGGTAGAASSGYIQNLGGDGGVGSSGDVNTTGGGGGTGIVAAANRSGNGFGGSSMLSGSYRAALGAGRNAVSPGQGGSGGNLGASTTQVAGGNGADGIVIVEWIAI